MKKFSNNQSKARARIAVTGAAGFIGSHTVDELLGDGCEVLGIDDLSGGRIENLESALRCPNFSFARFDILDREALDGAIRRFQPDAIVHLAGLVSVVRGEQDPELNYRLNTHATHLVAEAARRNGIPRLVFASSAAVYGNEPPQPASERDSPAPISLYGAAKFLSEQMLGAYSRSWGLEAVCLRFFNVYGPRQNPSSPYSGVISIFAERFAAGMPVTIFGDGTQTRDFIAVRDVARATRLAATRPLNGTAICNVCTGKARSLLDVLSVFRQRFPDAPRPVFEAARSGDILHSSGNPALARELLGFESRDSLEAGLGEWLQAMPEESAAVTYDLQVA